MVIKIDSEEAKVLGGGTQAYNKDTTDKRRPLIMTSPGQRQKALKRANDPEFKKLDAEIAALREELSKAYNTVDGLKLAVSDAQLAVEASKKIIADQEAVIAAKTKKVITAAAPKKKASPTK